MIHYLFLLKTKKKLLGYNKKMPAKCNDCCRLSLSTELRDIITKLHAASMRLNILVFWRKYQFKSTSERGV